MFLATIKKQNRINEVMSYWCFSYENVTYFLNTTIWNGKDGFEVKEWDKRYNVDIDKRTCSCRYWLCAVEYIPNSVTHYKNDILMKIDEHVSS
jgi:hypothetical protein